MPQIVIIIVHMQGKKMICDLCLELVYGHD
jgi:hypothetical protein